MTEARTPAQAQPSPRASRVALLLAGLFWGGVLAYFVYAAATTGEVEVPLKDGGSIVIRGWAAWVSCAVPVLAYIMTVVNIIRLDKKVALAISVAALVAMFAVILSVVPGPLNPFQR